KYKHSDPLISIIIPSFNQGSYLEETILSVIQQDFSDFEVIIIDGGSTDNSVSIIKKYSEHIAYWVSEADNGQAHAINKGLAVAK
ncbi:glycosyltransferase, partial [Shewanella algae]|uniref:glycosyltransferase n=1 Tax=Shewanella algae TaxID=38313 RepID=UPI00313B92F6